MKFSTDKVIIILLVAVGVEISILAVLGEAGVELWTVGFLLFCYREI